VWADALAARTSADAPAFERLAVGGAPVGLVEDATLSQRLLLPALPTGYRTGTRAEVVRTGLTVGGLMPYAGALRAHGTAEDAPSWTRLIGIEMRQATPFVPFARLPRSRVLAGVARVLDGPLADRTRGYVSVTFAP
jgi:hypothetical protein